MKRWMLLLAGLMLAFAAQASDSIRFGNQVITVGDSEGTVLRVAGKPDRRVQLENKYGAADGYRLDYDVQNRTIEIFISQGRVVDIDEVY